MKRSVRPVPNALQNFIQYLKFKQATMTVETDDKRVLPPEDDPILRAFGLLDVPPFSEAIDDVLYGNVMNGNGICVVSEGENSGQKRSLSHPAPVRTVKKEV